MRINFVHDSLIFVTAIIYFVDVFNGCVHTLILTFINRDFNLPGLQSQKNHSLLPALDLLMTQANSSFYQLDALPHSNIILKVCSFLLLDTGIIWPECKTNTPCLLYLTTYFLFTIND